MHLGPGRQNDHLFRELMRKYPPKPGGAAAKILAVAIPVWFVLGMYLFPMETTLIGIHAKFFIILSFGLAVGYLFMWLMGGSLSQKKSAYEQHQRDMREAEREKQLEEMRVNKS